MVINLCVLDCCKEDVHHQTQKTYYWIVQLERNRAKGIIVTDDKCDKIEKYVNTINPSSGHHQRELFYLLALSIASEMILTEEKWSTSSQHYFVHHNSHIDWPGN